MTGIGAPEFRNDPEIIEKIIKDRGSRWAVVGLSANKLRPVQKVAPFIAEKLGMEVIAINPKGENVGPFKGYKSLSDIPLNPITGKPDVDVVDVWISGNKAGAIVDEAIRIGADAVWMQLGVINERAAKRAQQAGLEVVMGTCPYIEAGKLAKKEKYACQIPQPH